MKDTAVLIIDVQNFFINTHTEELPKKIFDHLSNTEYGVILFTKFVNNPNSNFVKMLKWDKCSAVPDTDICKDLSCFVKSDNTFEKSTLSAFKNQKLVRLLRNKKIKKLYICGTDSEACVLSSAFEAFDLGFEVHTLKNLCASTNGKVFHDYAKAIIEKNIEPAEIKK